MEVENFPHDSMLINGRGRFGGNKAPLTVHNVIGGNTYLFRFINIGYDNYFEVSIIKAGSKSNLR